MRAKNGHKTYAFLQAVAIMAAVLVLLAGTVRAGEFDVFTYLYAPCYEFADKILDVIIDEDMDDYEKCCAVYNYIHKISYIDRVYSDDWVMNGYYMLYYRGGDCFGYYSASRLLLEQLGYQVIMMENNNGFTHYWSLVSTDNGETWYHFDPTCWRWGSDEYLCMVTDEELITYSYNHYWKARTLTHAWDQDKKATLIEECRKQIAEEASGTLALEDDTASARTGKNNDHEEINKP